MGFKDRDIYLFKVKGYDTVLAGEMEINEDGERIFLIRKDDGTKYEYPNNMVEWFKFHDRKVERRSICGN